MTPITRVESACISLLITLSLTGCAFGPAAAPVAEVGPTIHGTVHGGQQAIVGQNVYLLAANTTGYPTASTNASVSVLTSGSGQNSAGASVLPSAFYVTTDSNGDFTLTGNYSCTQGQQLYLYGVGGYTDGNSADVNPNIGLMAILGNCPAGGAAALATSIPFITMNEITTVAAGYAMSGFAYDATHVSSPSTTLALQGIKNAFANAALIANLATGAPASNITGSATVASMTVPSSQINTEGNILASCINEAPADFSHCITLFNNALQGGATGTAPTDTATAIINIAHHPYVSSTVMSNLFGLAGATGAPFVGGGQPTDWTMQILIGQNGLNVAHEMAVDQYGNLWAVNTTGVSISVFAPNGTAATTANSVLTTNSPLSGNGMFDPISIAFDSSGNAWVTDGSSSAPALSVFTSTGAVATSPASPITGNSMNTPGGIAFDTAGNLWVANEGFNTLSVFTASGAAATTSNSGLASNSPISGNGLNFPVGVAFDASGNLWAVDTGTPGVSVFNSTGAAASGVNSGSPITGNNLSGASKVAIDANGNAWVGNETTNVAGLSGFTSAGAAIGAYGPMLGGIHATYGVAVDAGNKVFTANESAKDLGELDPTNGAALSPTGTTTSNGGFQNSGAAPYAVAIDGSGTVWELNNSSNNLSMYIGLATPTVTPTIANRLPPYATNNSVVNKP